MSAVRITAAQAAPSPARAPAIRETPTNRPASSAAGQIIMAMRSASAVGTIVPAVLIRRAIGKSTSLDQWVTTPSGGFGRYWVWSNQLCPASKSRISTSRIASSVDGLLVPKESQRQMTATDQIKQIITPRSGCADGGTLLGADAESDMRGTVSTELPRNLSYRTIGRLLKT